MSQILQHKSERARITTARSYIDEVVEIDFGAGAKAPTVSLKNGAAGTGVCLGCADTPCAKKSSTESKLPLGFESFPGDPSQDLCPTQALRWNEKNNAMEVTGDCIGCGLCVIRCPYGAIAFDGNVAKVMPVSASPLMDLSRNNAVAVHPTPRRKGRVAGSTAPALRDMAQAVHDLADTRALLLVRNILHELGVQCSIRRRGDTNIRMDAIVAFADGKTGVAEIEFSDAVLDSPRALLEDIAVLHGRYAIPIENIVPLSIVLALPNGRSEYYQVIEDIRRVLGINCHTLTLPALLILLWHGARIEKLEDDMFTTSSAGAYLTKSVSQAIGKTAMPLEGEPYPGALVTAK